MKVTILGTAACEGIPAMFCNCEICRKAAERGGRELRTRSQALVNDDLLVDFPADTYMHTLQNHIELSRISSVLITHTHNDHYYPADFWNRAEHFTHNHAVPKLTVYGSAALVKRFEEDFPADNPFRNTVDVQQVEPYVPVHIGRYTVTPLPAVHTPEPEQSLIYLIESADGALLYGTDTYWPADGVALYLAAHGKRIDVACLDCTRALAEADVDRHMNADMVIRLTNLLRANGVFTADTAVIATHFSHNGKALHSDLEARLNPHGIAVAYDGMQVKSMAAGAILDKCKSV